MITKLPLLHLQLTAATAVDLFCHFLAFIAHSFKFRNFNFRWRCAWLAGSELALSSRHILVMLGIRIVKRSASTTQLFTNGQRVNSSAKTFIPVYNPATQELLTNVPHQTPSELESAVAAAKAAFPEWRNTPITVRQRVMFKLQDLIRQNMDDLAHSIVLENGKTFDDAKGDVTRGLEVVEHSCGLASAMMGETVENVSRNIDTYSYRQPLGVVAGICPFNFPAMIPLWVKNLL